MEAKLNIKKYFLLDSETVKNYCTYPFDIYKVNNELFELKNNTNQNFDFFDILKMKKSSYNLISSNNKFEEYSSLLEFLKEKQSVYKKASKLISIFFSNKDIIVTKKEIKLCANYLIEIVLDDRFKLQSFFELINHDYNDSNHSVNTALYSLYLGKFLEFNKTQLLQLATAALLHDVGKSKISKKLIYKKEFLTSLEYEKMKNHALYAYEIALRMGIKDRKVLFAIRSHHEKMDGTGYPDGLKNKKISLYARIICVCDVFDSLTSKKSYKDELSTFESIMLMQKTMSNELDMELLEKLSDILKK